MRDLELHALPRLPRVFYQGDAVVHWTLSVAHLKLALRPHRFQHQPHDHVFSEQERRRNAFAHVCAYIVNNPVRAQLVESAEDWRFCGAVVPGYPHLHPLEEDFWERFWCLYFEARDPAAGNRQLPRRSVED